MSIFLGSFGVLQPLWGQRLENVSRGSKYIMIGGELNTHIHEHRKCYYYFGRAKSSNQSCSHCKPKRWRAIKKTTTRQSKHIYKRSNTTIYWHSQHQNYLVGEGLPVLDYFCMNSLSVF